MPEHYREAEDIADGPDPDTEPGPELSAEDQAEAARLLAEHDPAEWNGRGDDEDDD